jgi:MFS family permease
MRQDKKGLFWFIRGNVLVLMVCRIIWSFSTSIVYPYFSLYILALGGTETEVGLINAVGIIAGMILYPLGGYIADKSGRVKLIGYATILYASTHIFFVLANHWTFILIGQFVGHLLLFYMPAMNALEADSLPPYVRGKGFALMMAVPSAVRIVAPVVGGYAIDWFQSSSGMTSNQSLILAVRICWGVALLTGFLVAWMRLRYLKETITDDEVGEPFSFGKIPEMLIPSYRSIIDSVKWMTPNIKVIVGIEIFTAFFIAMSAPFYVVYATKIVDITESQWGLLMFISGFMGIVVALPLGALVDRIGPRKMILTGMFLAPICIYGFTHTSGFISVVIVLCGLVLCNNIMMPAFSTIIANMIPRNRRGRLYSLMGERGISISFGNFWGGGFFIFPPAAMGALAGGYIYKYNNTLPWVITSLAMAIAFVFVYVFVHEPDKAQE